MSTAPTQNGRRLEPLTSFLSLAPTTSEGYPHRRTASSSTTATSASPPAQAAASDNTPQAAAADAVPAATPTKAELELKQRRSSSLGSEGSNGSARKLRFLSLGPVHHGEHLEGDGDWSEEIAVVE